MTFWLYSAKINVQRYKLKKILLIITVISALILSSHKALSYEAFDGNYQYNDVNNNNRSRNIVTSGITDEVLFIVDFSSSMNQKLGYTPKIYLAIDAIRNILSKHGKEMKVGLRIFGVTDKPLMKQTPRGIEFLKENICTASKLVLPIARYNNDNISDRLSYISPKGATPIGYSLRQAVQNDFSYGNHLKHIILVTDGAENCGDNPCLYIKHLMETRNDIVIDVIGITVSDNDYSQLKCIAAISGGRYYSVNTPEDFNIKFQEALKSRSVTPAPVTTMQSTINLPNVPFLNNTKYKTYGYQFDY